MQRDGLQRIVFYGVSDEMEVATLPSRDESEVSRNC